MRFLPIVLLVSLTCFVACVPDGTVSDEATVAGGRWELTTAFRNGAETGMLEGLYYEFGADGTLRTNLQGNESPGTYELEETTITTAGVRPPLTYEITELTDTTLSLRTELQNFRFDFELARALGGAEL